MFSVTGPKQHAPLIIILILQLGLAGAFASLVPLGEAPDEPAHLAYARFIATEGRLPGNLAERGEASYRSTWPPLYHFLIAAPVALVGDTPPTRLKSVGDGPRRLIPTNGQTIASFIHTADEAWPWRGIALAWHLGRFVSVALMAGVVIITYTIAWRLTRRRLFAASTAAVVAFLPQALFIGSVIHDDSLLIFLSSLILLALVHITQRPGYPGLGQLFMVGTLLGLASVTKYNALPLWLITIGWLGWLTFLQRNHTGGPARSGPDDRPPLGVLRQAALVASRVVALIAGAVVTSAWWFIFIWRHFNQVESQGLLKGSLAALSAGTSDASLRQLAAGGSFGLPSVATWLGWVKTLFQSFWGLFGGGGTIDLPDVIYWILAAIGVLALAGWLLFDSPLVSRPSTFSRHTPRFQPLWLILTLLFFLPLPVIRFLLSNGNIIESAQGRHLYPALPFVALALVLGLSGAAEAVARAVSRLPLFGSRASTAGATASPATDTVSPAVTMALLALPLFLFIVSLAALKLIRASYPPPIPLRTTTEDLPVDITGPARLVDTVTLLDFRLGPPQDGILPVRLIWQAGAVPADDYLISLQLVDPDGHVLGGWLGHPIGGRYPTRAWDKGDILYDTISVPILPGAQLAQATLTLSLLNSAQEPVSSPLILASNVLRSTQVGLPQDHPNQASTQLYPPQKLRADGLPGQASFGYRSTLSFALPGQSSPPEVVGPDGQTYAPAKYMVGSGGSVAHFIVEANWPSGDYQLAQPGPASRFRVSNRNVQFDTPPMAHILNANFADHVTLLGYDLPQRHVEPGQSFPVTLHFRAERTLAKNLVIFNHLLDQDAVQRGGVDRIPQEYYTTLLWVPGEIVSDDYRVPVQPAAPPGVYWLDVGLYPADKPSLSLPLMADGRLLDRNSTSLGPIKVGGPPPGLVIPQANPQYRANQAFGLAERLTLIGFTLIDPDGNPVSDLKLSVPDQGSTGYRLRLFWQVNAPLQADYTVFVHLFDAQGKLAGQADGPPTAGVYPTSLWSTGEIVVDERPLPPLAPGHYTLQLGFYLPDTGERLAAAGSADGSVLIAEFDVEPY